MVALNQLITLSLFSVNNRVAAIDDVLVDSQPGGRVIAIHFPNEYIELFYSNMSRGLK